EANKTLTLDGTTVTGGTISDLGTVNVDSGQTLNLSGVSLTGGAISNAGTIDITGSSSINSDAFTNTAATLIVDAGKTLTLNGTTVTGGTVCSARVRRRVPLARAISAWTKTRVKLEAFQVLEAFGMGRND